MSWAGFIDTIESHLLPCSVRELTGLSCPGCGMQSALIALLRGNLGESISANPALIPFIFTLAYTLLHLRLNFSKGPRNVLVFFSFTVSLMIANYLVRIGLFG